MDGGGQPHPPSYQPEYSENPGDPVAHRLSEFIMRKLFLAGVTLLFLSSPALAQPAAVPAPTGDPVLDRLNALEARLRRVEARNVELEQQVEFDRTRLQSVETRSAKAVQFGWAPTFGELSGAFTFKPRGVVDADAVLFHERRGGYDYNDGTALRRAHCSSDDRQHSTSRKTSHATRHDRTRQDGREHDRAPHARRSQGRSLRPQR